MPRKDQVLFYLDADKCHRLACDDLQWILQRGDPKHRRPGKDSGYRGISFIATDKSILLRCIARGGIQPSPEGWMLIHALPETFRESHARLKAHGIDDYRAWLRGRAKTLIRLAERALAA